MRRPLGAYQKTACIGHCKCRSSQDVRCRYPCRAGCICSTAASVHVPARAKAPRDQAHLRAATRGKRKLACQGSEHAAVTTAHTGLDRRTAVLPFRGHPRGATCPSLVVPLYASIATAALCSTHSWISRQEQGFNSQHLRGFGRHHNALETVRALEPRTTSSICPRVVLKFM